MPSRAQRRADQEAALPYYDTLVLYGQAVVNPGAAAGPNAAALANPHGLPMEIYEMIFTVYPKNTTEDVFNFITGMGIGIKLDMGEVAICDSKVPLDGFGNARDDADVCLESLAILSDPAVSDTVLTNPMTYRWRLKYPLPVPAGAVVTPVFEHLGQNPFPVVVDVIYLARTLPPDVKFPEKVKIPWVTAYNTNAYDNVNGTAAQHELSPELDIVNNFELPLEISRLTGRCSAVIADSPFSGFSVEQTAMEWGGDHRFRLMTLRVRGSRGDEIARVATPFEGLFPFQWRSWDIPGGWIMRPGEFYRFQLAVEQVSYTPRTEDIGRVQLAVTAVGYREISTRVMAEAALKPVPEVVA